METIQHHPSGLILCLIGFLLCYFVGRRRFNRRGIGGLQYYSCYGSALVTTLFEKLLKIIGILLIIAGLFTILNSRTHKPEKAASKRHTEVSKQIIHSKQ